MKKNWKVWNKGIYGYRLKHKKIEELKWDLLFRDIRESSLSISEISKRYQLSEPTIYKYVKGFSSELYNKLRENSRKKQGEVNRIRGGQVALYNKIRKEIDLDNKKCEICGSCKNIEIHHKERLHRYNNEYNFWKADNFNNDKNNIRILCNSCHQKLHWQEGDRILKVKQDLVTGRFISNG